MPWNLGLCCQSHWDIHDTWCCRVGLDTILFGNLDTLRFHHFQLCLLGIQLRLLDPIGRTLLALECISPHWSSVGRNQYHNFYK